MFGSPRGFQGKKLGTLCAASEFGKAARGCDGVLNAWQPGCTRDISDIGHAKKTQIFREGTKIRKGGLVNLNKLLSERR